SVIPALAELDAIEDETELEHQLEALLPESLVGGAQVVLGWAVLNYLQPRALRALMSRLAELLPPGARMHGFVAYGLRTLPATPRALAVLSEGRVRILPSHGGATREARGCPTGELQRLIPDFRVERAILLGDGMQECMFRR